MGTSQTKHNTTNTNHRNIHPQTKSKTVSRNPKSNTIAKQEGLTAQTHMLEKEAEIFLDQKYKGAQIRTKLYNNTNKTPDKQYLSLEQNVQKNRLIKEVKDTDGHTHRPPQNQRGIQTILQKPLHTRADVPDDTRPISTIRKAAKQHRQDRFRSTFYP